MKKIFWLLSILSIAILCNSCKKDKNVPPHDFFIISYCMGYGVVLKDYSPVYSITDTSLLCDTTHPNCFIPNKLSQLNFNYRLPDTVFTKVKNMSTSIPAEILNGNGSYGSFATVDGGETHIWASINGKEYFWIFADDQSNSSQAVQQFYFKLVDF